MENEFGLLRDDEVLFVRIGRILMPNATFKASELLDALAQAVSERDEEWSEDCEGWFSEDGLPCEVLRFGNQGWQRGRVRIRIEFRPEKQPKLLREDVQRRSNRDSTYVREEIYLKQNDIYEDDIDPTY
jgi:hypothetical protein